MARPGDVIEHPAYGVRITFLQTSAETKGELLRVEVVLPPGFSMAEHVHPGQEERHEVLAGTLRARVGGRQRDYGAGEHVVGPAGVAHAWSNPSEHTPLRLRSQHRPVLHMELMLEGGSAIARDWLANKKAVVGAVLRAAALLDEIKDDFYFTQWRRRAGMALLTSLAPLARWLGYGALESQAAPLR